MGKRSQPISIPLMLLLQQIGIISLLSLGIITVVKAGS
jgi:hypothetical protein